MKIIYNARKNIQEKIYKKELSLLAYYLIPMTTRYVIIPSVHLLLMKENKVLLILRANTGYRDGDYDLVAGHVDAGENFADAMIREAKEEVGIDLDRRNIKLVHILSKKNDDNTHDRVHAYFLATEWKGEVQNMEPDRCDGLARFAMDNLPENMIPCALSGIKNIEKSILYSEFGW